MPGVDACTSLGTFGFASVGKAMSPPPLDALRTPLDVKRWVLWATLTAAALVLFGPWMLAGALAVLAAA